jgi:hypothetical protein
MDVERYVTEWGFPVLCWRDRISNMKGLPQNPLPRIDTTEMPRRMWINFDGKQVLHHDGRSTGVVGHWHEWDSLVRGSDREDLMGEQLRLLGMNRLRWVEHQTLTAHFIDGTVNRVACSAVPQSEMEELHRAIHRTFLVGRANYAPPQDGSAGDPAHHGRPAEPLRHGDVRAAEPEDPTRGDHRAREGVDALGAVERLRRGGARREGEEERHRNVQAWRQVSGLLHP